MAIVSCTGPTTVEADPAVEPLAGDWEATALVLTNVADPDVSLDLIALGATFTLNIQPSGRYTATLIYLGQPGVEIGDLTVNGNVVTLDPDIPSDAPTTSGIYDLQGVSKLVVDGETEFDFNLDGEDEAALVHFELSKR